MKSIEIFPTYLLFDRLLGNAKNLKNLSNDCQKFRSIDARGEKWSQKNYPFGYTSYASIDNLPRISSEFAKVFKKIDRAVAEFSKKQEWNLGRQSLALESAWINIMARGAHHSFHIHPRSVVSGTLFLQTPQGSAPLKFEDPRLSRLMASPFRKENVSKKNQNHFSIDPKEGYVVLFESHLRHEVATHLAKQERISVSFNYHLAD